jgi:uncharacterized lipoprotein YddW (UPF0748 family)
METQRKKTYLTVIIFFTIILLFRAQLFAQTPDVVKGVWMYGSTLTSAGVTAVVNKLKANNVEQVYLLVKGGSGTKTSAPALTEFITAAHNNQVEVHFWYIVGDDNLYLSSHNDAHVYHSPRPGTSNDPYPMTDSKVNLLYPGYKDYVLENIGYFLDNFDCDGIHLDVIRYTHLVYSFDQNHISQAAAAGCNTNRILQLFRDDYNYYANNGGFINLYSGGDADVVKWVNMRKNVIYDYISSIRNLMQQKKPGIELSAAFMPEGATTPVSADVHYSQDYTLNSPLLDRISPMAYFKDYVQPTSWLKTVTEKAISKVSSNCKISTGYQAYNSVTAAEIREQVTYAMSGNSKGVVAFRYETATDANWAEIKELYNTVVPVELTSFTALYKERTVTLNWQTATETNNSGFSIERAVLPEKSWHEIGFVRGEGTTSLAQQYSYADKNINTGKYAYRLKQLDFDGTFEYSKEIEVDAAISPADYILFQNYPNPFNPATTIKYSLPFESKVSLRISNILGEDVALLVNETQPSGYYETNWNAKNISSGIYFYTLEVNPIESNAASGKNCYIRKMILLK